MSFQRSFTRFVSGCCWCQWEKRNTLPFQEDQGANLKQAGVARTSLRSFAQSRLRSGRRRRVPPPPVAPLPPPPPVPAAGPGPQMTRFNPALIANVLPNQAPSALKYIGRLFNRRFRDRGYATLQLILDRISRHTRASNRTWLRNILTNERSLQCTASNRSALFGRAPHNYRIRRENYFAYNAIVTYARLRLPITQRSRIPVLLQPETPAYAFPNRC